MQNYFSNPISFLYLSACRLPFQGNNNFFDSQTFSLEKKILLENILLGLRYTDLILLRFSQTSLLLPGNWRINRTLIELQMKPTRRKNRKLPFDSCTFSVKSQFWHIISTWTKPNLIPANCCSDEGSNWGPTNMGSLSKNSMKYKSKALSLALPSEVTLCTFYH